MNLEQFKRFIEFIAPEVDTDTPESEGGLFLSCATHQTVVNELAKAGVRFHPDEVLPDQFYIKLDGEGNEGATRITYAPNGDDDGFVWVATAH